MVDSTSRDPSSSNSRSSNSSYSSTSSDKRLVVDDFFLLILFVAAAVVVLALALVLVVVVAIAAAVVLFILRKPKSTGAQWSPHPSCTKTPYCTRRTLISTPNFTGKKTLKYQPPQKLTAQPFQNRIPKR